MTKDERDVLQVLRLELKFVEDGGYRCGSKASKPRSIFQSSPTCPNFGQPAPVRRCEDCVLMKFVPSERRAASVPCHHIPLNEAATTIESLALRDHDILEDSLKNWLRSTICQVEEERSHLLVVQRIELSEAHQPGPSRKRLLIVESDELLLIALEAILKSESYEIASGRGEEEAFHLLHRKRPDIILWGADLSDGASAKTLRILTKFRTLAPGTPVVVMQRAGVQDDTVVRSSCLASCSFVSKRELERIRILLSDRLSV